MVDRHRPTASTASTALRAFATRSLLILLVPALLGLAGLSAPLAAQPGPPPDKAIRVVAHFLELTEPQIESWVEILQGLHESVQPLAVSVHEREQELAALVESDTADATAIGSLVLEIRDVRREIYGLHQQASADFEALLAPEQIDRLTTARNVAPVARVLPALRALHLL